MASPYSVAGEMQEHYLHGVEACKKDPANEERVVVVFRDGEYCEYKKENGHVLTSLDPRPVYGPKPPGNNLTGLHKGSVYSRRELKKLGAHM